MYKINHRPNKVMKRPNKKLKRVNEVDAGIFTMHCSPHNLTTKNDSANQRQLSAYKNAAVEVAFKVLN